MGAWAVGSGLAVVQGASGPGSQLRLSSSGLRPSFAVLLLLSATWLLALLSVNSDTLLFHYLFAACNCVQVPGCALWRWGVGPGCGGPDGHLAAACCLPGPLHPPLLRGA